VFIKVHFLRQSSPLILLVKIYPKNVFMYLNNENVAVAKAQVNLLVKEYSNSNIKEFEKSLS